jgi:hypothetical protein
MNRSHPKLSFACSRRHFWRFLLNEAFVVIDSFNGQEGFRLADLDSLPDDQLAGLKPIINPDYKIFVDQGYVCGRSKKIEITLKLFPIKKENLTAFNLFDGKHSLGQVAEHLAAELGWDKARAFAHARELFLSLVNRLVCIPKDPLPPAT